MKGNRVGLAVVLACLALCGSERVRDAEACGGPDFGDFMALAPLGSQLHSLERPDQDFDANLREELTFDYPLDKQRPAEFGALVEFLHGVSPKAALPTTQAMQAALERADLAGARRAALAAIDALYALPPALATPLVRSVLWPAVEVVELAGAPGFARAELLAFLDRRHAPDRSRLAPRLQAAFDARSALETGGPLPLTADNPRAPSLGFLAFQRDFAARVPNGYLSEIQASPARALLPELLRNVDAWIAAHPTHPLADLAALWKVRIQHFAGARDAEWAVPLALWPRRPVRAAAEMAFLIRADGPPSDGVIESLRDPLLIAALANQVSIDAARFSKWWRLAQREPQAPWSICLQERLLLAASKGDWRLPPEFPEHVSAPTPLWGKLRAFALARVHRDDDAIKELAALPPDQETARLLIRLHLAHDRPEAALSVPAITADERAYIVKTKLSETALRRISTSARTPEAAAAAAFELALYAVRRGNWAAAAPLAARGAPERAEAFQAAAKLAASPDHDLALARYLVEHSGELLARSFGFYRGLSELADGARGTDERTYHAIADALLRSSERFLALELYCHWLANNMKHPDARDVLAEADQNYARLINQGGSDEYFFGKYAPTSKVATELRRLGKLIRART